MAGDAVRPTRPDDDVGADRLDAPIRMRKLDGEIVGIRLHLRRPNPPLDNAAERREVSLEDPLGFILREAALELTATVDALEVQAAELEHIRIVQADAVDLLGG